MDSNELSFRLPNLLLVASLLMTMLSGCSSTTPKWIEQPWAPIDSAALDSGTSKPSDIQSRVSVAKSAEATVQESAVQQSPVQALPSEQPQPKQGRGILVANQSTTELNQTVRGQAPGYGQGSATRSYVPPAGGGQFQTFGSAPAVAPTNPVYQQPQQPVYSNFSPAPQQIIPPQGAAPGIGQPTQFTNQGVPFSGQMQQDFADIDVLVREAQTGRVTFGAAFNSNSGLVGQFIIDERNFDIRGFPRSVSEIVDGTAWKGAGQGFRLELVPGNEVQRYLASFTEPYLFNSQVSFSASGYFFDRRYEDWDEQRLGGRFSLGYRLTPDLSLSAGLRLEEVNIHDPRVDTSPALNSVLGDNSLFLAEFSLINDTRDHPFLATEGSYLELSYSQGFGDFDYPRGEVDYRRYWLLRQRPDQSGRHTLSFGTKLGFSGSSTPIFENFFAGGFSTLRGFDFRGASPVEGGVAVGGQFQWLNSLQYTFPITADDMIKGVFFCDFGTVEQEIELNDENFRVAPGFGFRVHLPVGGAGGAPLAFDFAFPVEEAEGDDRQVFSFHMTANQ